MYAVYEGKVAKIRYDSAYSLMKLMGISLEEKVFAKNIADIRKIIKEESE